MLSSANESGATTDAARAMPLATMPDAPARRGDGRHKLVTEPRVAPGTPTRAARRRDLLRRYALAVGVMAAAVSLRVLLGKVLGNHVPFLLQFVAVLASAAFGGLGPGLLATGLASIAGYVLVVAPMGINSDGGGAGFGGAPGAGAGVGGAIGGGETLAAQLIVFALEGCLISAMGGWLHWARRRAEAADVARASLEKQMLDVGDNERRRFGHDLHDGLGQQLTGIALLSESLSHRLESAGSPLAGQAEQITTLVTETIGWTRELARGLSPLTLETDGLVAALEELATRATRLFGVTCTFDCEHDTLPIAAESAVHLYRIIQEAVSNSVKHGKARRVSIRVVVANGSGGSGAGGSTGTGGSEMTMTVSDDGSGLSAKTVAQPGIGLRIMQYRANLIGAKLSVVRATPHGGTIVTCTISNDKVTTSRQPAASAGG